MTSSVKTQSIAINNIDGTQTLTLKITVSLDFVAEYSVRNKQKIKFGTLKEKSYSFKHIWEI